VTDPSDVGIVIVVIGGKGRLSYTEGKLAAQSFISSYNTWKNAEFSIALSGFDDTKDEVMKDPDVIGYVTLVLSEIAKCIGDDITTWRLCETSTTMIARVLSEGLTQQ
jgi:hypothetical protein